MEEERRGELGRRAGESGWEPANVLSRLSARRGRFPLTPAGLRGKDQKRVAFGTFFFFNCYDQIVHKKQMKGEGAHSGSTRCLPSLAHSWEVWVCGV